MLSAALENYNISVAPDCCAAVHSVQSICFCTHHICHISLSYIWPLPTSPHYLTRLDNLFLMNVQPKVRSEAVFVCLFYMKVWYTWILVFSHNCYKPLLTSACLSVRPSFLREQICSNWTDFHYFWCLRFFRFSNWKIPVSLQSHTVTELFMKPPVH